MNARIVLLFVLQFVAASVIAAGFDCTQASSRVERMICADPELSFLDDALARYYQDVLSDESDSAASNKASLQREQRRWLARRDKCRDAVCIKVAYEARVEEIYKLRIAGTNCDTNEGLVDPQRCEKPSLEYNPFADGVVTCAEMRRYPGKVFRDDIDLGSGSMSPIEV